MIRIAAVTMLRNDDLFLPKWVAHYGRAFGPANLLVVLDGHDQRVPDGLGPVNVVRVPHEASDRATGDRRRARLVSHFAAGLFELYDRVIATDVDEFLVLDPNAGVDLATYLAAAPHGASASALGLDVAQHLREETALDPAKPFLSQRAYAHVSARYTKPCVATRPVTWGSGLHRVKGRNFRIDPNLYLFHFGMVDHARATARHAGSELLADGWKGHLERRERLFRTITGATPLDGDDFFPKARRTQSWRRQLFAWNKPALIPGDPVVRIPARFRDLV